MSEVESAGGADLITLAVETSCDETSAAILRGDRDLLGHVIFTQDVHRIYGGVVPELASRAHLRTVDDVVEAALVEAGVGLERIGLVGVTAGPGLIGALLVGLVDTLLRSFSVDILRLTVLSPSDARTIGPAIASMSIYILMAAVLFFRPTGLFPAKG